MLLGFLLNSSFLFSQVGINTDGSNPHPSAILDAKSTQKGFLPPRMTLAEMNAIASPAPGLMVCCTDCGPNGSGTLAMFANGTWSIFDATCLAPGSPVTGVHTPSLFQIIWNWNAVAAATGYKWNTTNNYATAISMGTATTKTETGLTTGTTYTRYVWAYNTCGISTSTTSTAQTVSFVIGQSYGGGIIFYLDGTGQHGLIAATSDQSIGAQWGCSGTAIGGTFSAIAMGQTNTTAIVNGCNQAGIAARICDDLVLNGYSDWFLPSLDELNQMCLQKAAIGGFEIYGTYQSSSEHNDIYVWVKSFYQCMQFYNGKNSTYWVRAVRAF